MVLGGTAVVPRCCPVRPHDIRWGAESAIYTVPLALSRIFVISDGMRSPLFTQLRWRDRASSLRRIGCRVRYLHGPVGFTTHLYDVRWGAEYRGGPPWHGQEGRKKANPFLGPAALPKRCTVPQSCAHRCQMHRMRNGVYDL